MEASKVTSAIYPRHPIMDLFFRPRVVRLDMTDNCFIELLVSCEQTRWHRIAKKNFHMMTATVHIAIPLKCFVRAHHPHMPIMLPCRSHLPPVQIECVGVTILKYVLADERVWATESAGVAGAIASLEADVLATSADVRNLRSPIVAAELSTAAVDLKVCFVRLAEVLGGQVPYSIQGHDVQSNNLPCLYNLPHASAR